MSRKEDSKAKDAVVSVNVEDYTKTRDSVIISLAQLQSAVSDLSRAYINHTNTVLNPGSSNIDFGSLTSGITSTLFESGLLGARPTSPGAKSEVGEKKKRKRAPPDPNAPKRALTPFFLYMQHNRAKIAEELGTSAKPKEVSDEGTRRWADMPEAQKEVWKKLYADNLAVYKEKMKAYKAGLPFGDDDSAKAANQLQQDVEGISASGAEETDDEDEEEEEEAQEPEPEPEQEEEEIEESEPEPVKEPTPPRSTAKRRRSEGKTKETSTPVVEKKESPEKKKRTSARKAAEELPASARKPAADNKRTKKKRKSEAPADE
ncbi:high mobility group protein [Aspergillus melleus]|uniref:high mobility group protein n=1 Tax=Aspergillus melleus TaxID=138277 RepID=UPI001E8E02CC|nr:high mobility group protein [Aspergillus melleus]KAH8422594.1 high mobility group protein [Aspergillus melleus]